MSATTIKNSRINSVRLQYVNRRIETYHDTFGTNTAHVISQVFLPMVPSSILTVTIYHAISRVRERLRQIVAANSTRQRHVFNFNTRRALRARKFRGEHNSQPYLDGSKDRRIEGKSCAASCTHTFSRTTSLNNNMRSIIRLRTNTFLMFKSRLIPEKFSIINRTRRAKTTSSMGVQIHVKGRLPIHLINKTIRLSLMIMTRLLTRDARFSSLIGHQLRRTLTDRAKISNRSHSLIRRVSMQLSSVS